MMGGGSDAQAIPADDEKKPQKHQDAARLITLTDCLKIVWTVLKPSGLTSSNWFKKKLKKLFSCYLLNYT